MESLHTAVFWGRWDLVLISIMVHTIILFFFIGSSLIKPKKVDFRSKGILFGFIVALYFEMYGIPLTIFLIQPLLGKYVLSYYPVHTLIRLTGSILIFVGFVLIYLGWKQIHTKADQVVRKGIYAYLRHPQYVGLALLTLGQLVQWPTITGLILWPFIILIYYKLAHQEERDAIDRFGEEYVRYAQEVPAFFPDSKLINRKLVQLKDKFIKNKEISEPKGMQPSAEKK